MFFYYILIILIPLALAQKIT